jgi:hypothetical protein
VKQDLQDSPAAPAGISPAKIKKNPGGTGVFAPETTRDIDDHRTTKSIEATVLFVAVRIPVARKVPVSGIAIDESMICP